MVEKVHVVPESRVLVTRLSVFQHQAFRFLEAVNPAPGLRPPDDAAATAVESTGIAVLDLIVRVPAPRKVDCGILYEEHHLRVGQMVMDEPCQGPPVTPHLLVHPVDETGDEDAHRRAHVTVTVLVVPDVVRVARCVRGTVHIVAVAESVHVGATESRTDRDVAEHVPKWLQQVPAEGGA